MLRSALPLTALAVSTALAALSTARAAAAQPPLWTPLPEVPADLRAWDAAQRADDPSITGSTFVRLDTGALRAIALQRPGAAQRFRLDLPGGRTEPARIERTATSAGHDVFFGAVRDNGRLTLALRHDGPTALATAADENAATAAAAEIVVDDLHATLNATIRDGYYVLRTNDVARLGIAPCGTDDSWAVHAPRGNPKTPGGAAPPPATADPSGRTVVDVMVFYTPPVRQHYGGHAPTRAEIALRVANASDACARCNVDIEYRLVYAGEVNYQTGGDMGQDLSRFRSTGDGFMDQVHVRRNERGGDLMALITGSGNYCGIGYLMRPSSPGFGPNAFSVTQRSCLRGHTLTHELGHNQGCHHDRANASSGAWPYSFGYRTSDDAYRTIMSYSPGSRVNYWSSPNVTFQGYVMGTPADDNARGLNDSKNDIRRFFRTRTIEWCNLGGGIAGRSGEPTLDGSGTIDNSVPIELRVGNTIPGASGTVVVGTQLENRPFFGGTLIPDIGITLPLTGSAADLTVDLAAMSSIPTGAAFYFQTFFLDATAIQGVSASDGLKAVVP